MTIEKQTQKIKNKIKCVIDVKEELHRYEKNLIELLDNNTQTPYIENVAILHEMKLRIDELIQNS